MINTAQLLFSKIHFRHTVFLIKLIVSQVNKCITSYLPVRLVNRATVNYMDQVRWLRFA